MLIAILPANREGVLHEQLLKAIPRLAAQIGNHNWTLSPDADRLLQKAFAEARNRRSAASDSDMPIALRGAATSAGYHLLAVRGSEQREEVISPVTAWSLFPPVAAILVAIISGRLILGLSLAILAGGFLASLGEPLYLWPVIALKKSTGGLCLDAFGKRVSTLYSRVHRRAYRDGARDHAFGWQSRHCRDSLSPRRGRPLNAPRGIFYGPRHFL